MSRIQRSRSVGQMVVALGAWALATSVPAVATAQTIHQFSELGGSVAPCRRSTTTATRPVNVMRLRRASSAAR